MSKPPVQSGDTPTSLFQKSLRGMTDIVLFVIILCFTGVTVIAVAIAAPLALGISAIIGNRRNRRPGWKPAKAG